MDIEMAVALTLATERGELDAAPATGRIVDAAGALLSIIAVTAEGPGPGDDDDDDDESSGGDGGNIDPDDDDGYDDDEDDDDEEPLQVLPRV